MHNNTVFPSIVVTKKQEKSLRAGSLWVYDDEILSQEGMIGNGAVVDVFSEKGTYLGSGLWSEVSRIRVRILGKNANEVYDDAFWMRRVRYAVDYRKQVMGDDFRACRLIHGEADGLPGVTVDRYENVLVSEIQSYGMEQRKGILYRTLMDLFAEDGTRVYIYERNEGALRRKEGLVQEQGWYTEAGPDKVVIEECGIRYEVDIVNGQKTGFFLDQKYNRVSVRTLSRGLRVLDCCTHTGAFALNAVMGGAAEVTGVDISETALAEARRNAALNGMQDGVRFVQADMFEFLEEALERHAGYDMIILDPPAFTKSRKTVHNAEKGYKEINFRAMKLLPRGGYLATYSCSHFMEQSLFEKMLKSASADAGVQLKLIEERRQAPDHPVLLTVPETDYLKFYLFQVV